MGNGTHPSHKYETNRTDRWNPAEHKNPGRRNSVVWGCAGDLPGILAEHEISTVDLMVSGLPWSEFIEPMAR